MKFHRIRALFWRHALPISRSLYRYTDLFYWPFFDVLIWGYASMSFQGSASQAASLLTSLVGWQIVNRSHMSLALNFNEEISAQNFVSLFSTPLCVGEWVIASLLLGVVQAIISLIFGSMALWLLCGLPFLKTLLLLLTFFPILMISGWCFGFFALTVLTHFGQQASSIIWVVGWLPSSLSGVFYPVSLLPGWAQRVSFLLPTTRIFSQIRAALVSQSFSPLAWLVALLVACIWFAASYLIFYVGFKRKKIVGLAQLDSE